MFNWLKNLLLGSKPKVPPAYQSILNAPIPKEFMDYLQTGRIPEMTSTSGSSSTSTTNTQSNMRGSSQFSQQPFILPEWMGLLNPVRGIVYNRLTSPEGSLPQGYRAEGLRNIGQVADINRSAMTQNLLSRGLFGRESGSEAALAQDTMGQQASFLNSLPLLQRQLQNEDLGLASELVNIFGKGLKGQSQTQQQTNTRSQTDSSSSGFSTTPEHFDIGGWGNLYNQAWALANAPRQGGLLQSPLAGYAWQWLFNRGTGSGTGRTPVPPYNPAGYGG